MMVTVQPVEVKQNMECSCSGKHCSLLKGSLMPRLRSGLHTLRDPDWSHPLQRQSQSLHLRVALARESIESMLGERDRCRAKKATLKIARVVMHLECLRLVVCFDQERKL